MVLHHVFMVLYSNAMTLWDFGQLNPKNHTSFSSKHLLEILWKNMSEIAKENGLYWDEWTINGVHAWVQLISHTLLCIFIIVLLYRYLKIFCNKTNNETNNDKLFIILLLISLIMSFINIYGHYILTTIGILVFNYRPNKGCFYRTLIQITVLIQRMVVYGFFLFRLKFTFTDGLYRISNIKFGLILITILIVGVMFIIYSIIIASLVDTFQCTGDMYVYFVGGFFVAVVLDAFWSFILVYMFNRRVRGITKHASNNIENVELISRKLLILS